MSWQGAAYRAVTPVIHEAWGQYLVDELVPRGDETALDAGCGTGRVTQMLLEALPRGRVHAVDASQSMLDEATALFARHPRGRDVTLTRADLAVDPLPGPVELIFSSATFHWIADHDALFTNLRTALAPGGRLRAQCGGHGNLQRVHRAVLAAVEDAQLSHRFGHWKPASHFATAEQTAERLARAGFTQIRTWLEPWPTPPFADAASFVKFTRAVNLVQFLGRLADPAEQDRLVEAFVKRMESDRGGYVVDYIRLNLDCRVP